jgi:hypothetical protein
LTSAGYGKGALPLAHALDGPLIAAMAWPATTILRSMMAIITARPSREVV